VWETEEREVADKSTQVRAKARWTSSLIEGVETAARRRTSRREKVESLSLLERRERRMLRSAHTPRKP
jgi:hypothetical protein